MAQIAFINSLPASPNSIETDFVLSKSFLLKLQIIGGLSMFLNANIHMHMNSYTKLMQNFYAVNKNISGVKQSLQSIDIYIYAHL